jgi:hypothetical protein
VKEMIDSKETVDILGRGRWCRNCWQYSNRLAVKDIVDIVGRVRNVDCV